MGGWTDGMDDGGREEGRKEEERDDGWLERERVGWVDG